MATDRTGIGGRPRAESGTVRIQVRMPAELVARLEATARREGIDRDPLVRRAVSAWLDRLDALAARAGADSSAVGERVAVLAQALESVGGGGHGRHRIAAREGDGEGEGMKGDCEHPRQAGPDGHLLPCATCWDSGDVLTVPRWGLPHLSLDAVDPRVGYETITYRRAGRVRGDGRGVTERWHEWERASPR